MTNQSKDKKSLPRVRATAKGIEKLRQKYNVEDNIPEGSELVIDTTRLPLSRYSKAKFKQSYLKKRTEDK